MLTNKRNESDFSTKVVEAYLACKLQASIIFVIRPPGSSVGRLGRVSVVIAPLGSCATYYCLTRRSLLLWLAITTCRGHSLPLRHGTPSGPLRWFCPLLALLGRRLHYFLDRLLLRGHGLCLLHFVCILTHGLAVSILLLLQGVQRGQDCLQSL